MNSTLRVEPFLPDRKARAGDPVVPASGGPVMRIEGLDGDAALCSWSDGGYLSFGQFPTAHLRRILPFVARHG